MEWNGKVEIKSSTQVKMAIPYALRYTLINTDTDANVLKWINEKSPGHLVIKHTADEDVPHDHWHALIWSDKKPEALRKDWSKSNPEVKGNKAYSLTEIKKKSDEDPVEAYERYMCHGKELGDPVNVVSAFGAKYTEEWFKEQNQLYYSKQKEFKKKEQKKSETKNLVNDLLKECEAAGLHERQDIVMKLVQMYKKERRPMNTYYMRQVSTAVWSIIRGKEADQLICEEIMSRI